MEAFAGGLLAVGLAELGDKTQLLVFVLVRQFRRPLIVALALMLAFLVSYAAAGAFGGWIGQSAVRAWFEWLSALLFIVIGCWILLAHSERDSEIRTRSKLTSKGSVFAFAFVTILIGELGDKSQLSVLALAMHLEPVWLIVAGALIGSLIVNLPVIWLGQQSSLSPWMNPRLQLWIRWLAGGLFILLGLLMLLSLFSGAALGHGV